MEAWKTGSELTKLCVARAVKVTEFHYRYWSASRPMREPSTLHMGPQLWLRHRSTLLVA